MRTGRVSLCMIVRNEAEQLGRCLDAARPLVDEICIIDTGSTDETVAIAEARGARVRAQPWSDCFSTARNASLEMATGDWILVLDADEVIRPGQRARLDRVIDSDRIAAASLAFTNHYDGDRTLACAVLRLFRNDPRHRFAGAIHEQVAPSIVATSRQNGRGIVEGALAVDHYGYLDAQREGKGKDERNRRLFRKALDERPDDPYLWYKYGDFLRRDDGLEVIEAALARSCELLEELPARERRDHAYAGEAYAILALELAKADRLDAARSWLDRSAGCEPTALLHWVRGHVGLRRGDWSEALASFEACREFDGRLGPVPVASDIPAGRSEFGAARALLGLGRTEDAFARFLRGAASHPDCADLVQAAIQIDASQGRPAEAMARCTDWLQDHPETAAVWRAGADVLLELGLVQKAEIWTGRAEACADRETAGEVRALRGAVSLARGDLEAALDAWNGAFREPRSRAGLALLFLVLGEPLPADLRVDAVLIESADLLLRQLARAPGFEPCAARLRGSLEEIPGPLRRVIKTRLAGPAVAST